MDANLLLERLPAQFRGRLTALTGGLTNQSWRLETEQHCYWLRLGNPHSAGLGIDREQELLAHLAAADAGLAPRIHYAEPALGILILDWLAEPDWQELVLPLAALNVAPLTAAPLTPVSGQRGALRSELTLLMTKVAHLHRLSPALKRLSLTAQAERYLRQLTAISDELTSYARRFEQADLNLDYKAVFCHHDLNAANIVGTRPWLIDWEYAGLGDGAFELAVIADSFMLDARQALQLLADYNAAGGEVTERQFAARRPWVFWLTALWAALQYQYTAQFSYRQLEWQALSQLKACLANVERGA